MIDGLRVLALIPARGGSKGVPRKNIRMLGDKPVIAHTIAAAQASAYVDRIVVSTDDTEIALIAQAYGAEVPFMRPVALASDTARTVDAVVHALETLAAQGDSFDVLVLLQPTSPMRTGSQIDEALALFVAHGEDVVGVEPVTDSPVLIRTMEEQRLAPLLNEQSTVRRQDMKPFYVVNGAMYVNRVSTLSLETSFNDNPIGYVMPHQVDLDTEEDMAYAAWMLARRLEGEV